MNKKRMHDRLLQGLTLLLLLKPAAAWTLPEIKAPISHSAEDLQPPIDATSFIQPEQPALTAATPSTQPSELNPQNSLDLDPALIERSPVLQRWVDQVPDVASDITNDPSFRTRIRLGYSKVSSDHAAGFNIGVEDIRLDRTRLTVSADYQAAFAGDRGSSWGSDLRYYVRPLGNYINFAPVIGYRHLSSTDYSKNGVNLGFRVLLALSRRGGSDISLTQTWVAPGSNEEAGLLTLSFGYALTHQIRLSTDLQRQNTSRGRESRFGIGLEWML